MKLRKTMICKNDMTLAVKIIHWDCLDSVIILIFDRKDEPKGRQKRGIWGLDIITNRYL